MLRDFVAFFVYDVIQSAVLAILSNVVRDKLVLIGAGVRRTAFFVEPTRCLHGVQWPVLGPLFHRQPQLLF